MASRRDGAATQASLRTLGDGEFQAAPGKATLDRYKKLKKLLEEVYTKLAEIEDLLKEQ